MRTREIIERETKGFDPRLMPYPKAPEELVLEVLLDIRDLLAKHLPAPEVTNTEV